MARRGRESGQRARDDRVLQLTTDACCAQVDRLEPQEQVLHCLLPPSPLRVGWVEADLHLGRAGGGWRRGGAVQLQEGRAQLQLVSATLQVIQ